MKKVAVMLEDGSRLCVSEVANNPWNRMVGLLGRSVLPEGEGLLIKPCSSVHSFFMRFPIDVIYLDKENVVLKAVHLQVNRISRGGRGAKDVLELPGRTIEQSGIKPGDRLSILPIEAET